MYSAGATDINDKGMVLGWWTEQYTQGDVVVWVPRTDRTVTVVPAGRFEYAYENAINNRGQVVLSPVVSHHTYNRAYLWDRKTKTLTDIGDLGGPFARALDINDDGWVVGGSHTQPTRPHKEHAFLWRPKSDVMVDLGTLGGRTSLANAINDRGQIAGVSGTANGNRRAFLWDPRTKKMTKLGMLGPRTVSCEVADLNNKAQVVGTCHLGDRGVSHAFLWRPRSQRMVDLGTLGGRSSWATAINDSSQVVGYSTTARGHQLAFLWHPKSHTMSNLGKLEGSSHGSVASAINSRTQIVGSSWPRAFLWTPRTREMVDITAQLTQ